MKPLQEVVDFILGLKNDGLTIGLLSNVVPPTASSIRKYAGYDAFDFVVLSCEVGLLKPDKRTYERVLSEMNTTSGGHVLYIDDFKDNLVPADALGMKTVLAVNPSQMIEAINILLDRD